MLSFRWVTAHFSDVFLKAVCGDGEDRVCFLFFSQNHKVLLLLWVYANKSRHLTFIRRFYPKRLTFKLQFYILSALAFPGNRTHDFGVASAMLYHLSYRKAHSFGWCITLICVTKINRVFLVSFALILKKPSWYRRRYCRLQWVKWALAHRTQRRFWTMFTYGFLFAW